MPDVRWLPVPDGLEGERVDAALAREIEQGEGIGQDRLDPLPVVDREEHQGGREVAQEIARDFRAQLQGALLVEILVRPADLLVQAAVGAALLASRPIGSRSGARP